MRASRYRRKSEEQAGRRSIRRGEQQDEHVNADLARPGRLVGYARTSASHTGTGQPQPERAACQRQQHAFGHRLPQQPAAAGAKRRAHRKFTTTRLGCEPWPGSRDSRSRSAGPARPRLAAPRSRGSASPTIASLQRLQLQDVVFRDATDAVVGTWPFTPARSPQFSRNTFSSVWAACGVTPSFSRPMTLRNDCCGSDGSPGGRRSAARFPDGCPSDRRQAA